MVFERNRRDAPVGASIGALRTLGFPVVERISFVTRPAGCGSVIMHAHHTGKKMPASAANACHIYHGLDGFVNTTAALHRADKPVVVPGESRAYDPNRSVVSKGKKRHRCRKYPNANPFVFRSAIFFRVDRLHGSRYIGAHAYVSQ